MASLVIEGFGDVTAWTAKRPGGGASTSVSLDAGGPARLPGLTSASATLTVAAGALGHYVERASSGIDLRPWPDLLLWVRSDRVGTGAPDLPHYLEVRLGSAALPIGSPGNTWSRLVPVDVAGQWQPVPLSLADLPGAARQAVTRIRLTCVEASLGWSMQLDAILAVLPEALVDADAALLGRLDNRLVIAGNPVPAVVVPVDAPAPTPPVLRLSNYDVRPDRARTPIDGPRTDYTGATFSVRPAPTVYQLDYAIEALAADRDSEARMLQFVLDELTPTAVLTGAGRTISAEWIDQPPTAAPPAAAPPPDHPVVHVRLVTSQPGLGDGQRAVPPYHDIVVEVDQHA